MGLVLRNRAGPQGAGTRTPGALSAGAVPWPLCWHLPERVRSSSRDSPEDQDVQHP